eukprot:jgi/Mesvir1/23057/Mv08170-RA.2
MDDLLGVAQCLNDNTLTHGMFDHAVECFNRFFEEERESIYLESCCAQGMEAQQNRPVAWEEVDSTFPGILLNRVVPIFRRVVRDEIHALNTAMGVMGERARVGVALVQGMVENSTAHVESAVRAVRQQTKEEADKTLNTHRMAASLELKQRMVLFEKKLKAQHTAELASLRAAHTEELARRTAELLHCSTGAQEQMVMLERQGEVFRREADAARLQVASTRELVAEARGRRHDALLLAKCLHTWWADHEMGKARQQWAAQQPVLTGKPLAAAPPVNVASLVPASEVDRRARRAVLRHGLRTWRGHTQACKQGKRLAIVALAKWGGHPKLAALWQLARQVQLQKRARKLHARVIFRRQRLLLKPLPVVVRAAKKLLRAAFLHLKDAWLTHKEAVEQAEWRHTRQVHHFALLAFGYWLEACAKGAWRAAGVLRRADLADDIGPFMCKQRLALRVMRWHVRRQQMARDLVGTFRRRWDVLPSFLLWKQARHGKGASERTLELSQDMHLLAKATELQKMAFFDGEAAPVGLSDVETAAGDVPRPVIALNALQRTPSRRHGRMSTSIRRRRATLTGKESSDPMASLLLAVADALREQLKKESELEQLRKENERLMEKSTADARYLSPMTVSALLPPSAPTPSKVPEMLLRMNGIDGAPWLGKLLSRFGWMEDPDVQLVRAAAESSLRDGASHDGAEECRDQDRPASSGGPGPSWADMLTTRTSLSSGQGPLGSPRGRMSMSFQPLEMLVSRAISIPRLPLRSSGVHPGRGEEGVPRLSVSSHGGANRDAVATILEDMLAAQGTRGQPPGDAPPENVAATAAAAGSAAGTAVVPGPPPPAMTQSITTQWSSFQLGLMEPAATQTSFAQLMVDGPLAASWQESPKAAAAGTSPPRGGAWSPQERVLRISEGSRGGPAVHPCTSHSTAPPLGLDPSIRPAVLSHRSFSEYAGTALPGGQPGPLHARPAGSVPRVSADNSYSMGMDLPNEVSHRRFVHGTAKQATNMPRPTSSKGLASWDDMPAAAPSPQEGGPYQGWPGDISSGETGGARQRTSPYRERQHARLRSAPSSRQPSADEPHSPVQRQGGGHPRLRHPSDLQAGNRSPQGSAASIGRVRETPSVVSLRPFPGTTPVPVTGRPLTASRPKSLEAWNKILAKQ